MLQCWQENGEDRPSFKELLNMLKLISPTEDSNYSSIFVKNEEDAREYQVTSGIINNDNYAQTNYRSVADQKPEETYKHLYN